MHLFLEGPIRTGKSTIIRQCLSPYIRQGNVGGFSCQRLWENNNPCGYRLTYVSELELDAPFDQDASGIFLRHEGQKTKKELSIFESSAVALLEDAKGSKLILLDEIGGIDLLVPAFREKLYEILAGSIPCIGVLKSNANAQHIGKKSSSSAAVTAYNEQLRYDLLHRFDAQILHYTPEVSQDICCRINAFLHTHLDSI